LAGWKKVDERSFAEMKRKSNPFDLIKDEGVILSWVNNLYQLEPALEELAYKAALRIAAAA